MLKQPRARRHVRRMREVMVVVVVATVNDDRGRPPSYIEADASLNFKGDVKIKAE